MGRPRDPESLVALSLRVRPGSLVWLEQVAGQEGVATAELARNVLNDGKHCRERSCAGWVKVERLAIRVEELLAELDKLQASAPLDLAQVNPTVAASLAPLSESSSPDPRECLPSNMRHLDDKGLLRFNICPVHLGELTACAHDHEDPA